MAKKKVSASKTTKKGSLRPASQEAKVPESILHHKRQVLMQGIGLHLVVYMMISILIYLMGAPASVSMIVFMVLFWGLFVMSYAYYYHK